MEQTHEYHNNKPTRLSKYEPLSQNPEVQMLNQATLTTQQFVLIIDHQRIEQSMQNILYMIQNCWMIALLGHLKTDKITTFLK